MKTKVVVVEILETSEQSIVALCKKVAFSDANGGSIAKLYDTETSDPKDSKGKILWISSYRGKADCLHSQYGAATKSQTGLWDLLTIRGLFTLAVFLHENREHTHPMSRFTGVVYAFGSAQCAEKVVLNHESHTGHHILDMRTPVLWIEKGIPGSIYFMWHAEFAEKCGHMALQMSSEMFSLEEVMEWAKEAVFKKEVAV